MKHWIWLHPDWLAQEGPRFVWRADALADALRAAQYRQGQLLGKAQGAGPALSAEFSLDAMLQNIVQSSAIEGEVLNVGSVRSSLARRLGLDAPARGEARSEGLAQIMFDATGNLAEPLTLQRLLQWHQWLFADVPELMALRLHVGDWRGDETMQVVSGRIDKPTIHFEAPPRDVLDIELARFVVWFNASHGTLDPLLRAAIAHFWLVTLHPFEDGNGRITRALTDLALAQGEGQSVRFYAMSAAIQAQRKQYYDQLETHQSIAPDVPLDLTGWLAWFLATLTQAMDDALGKIDRVLGKSHFWLRYRDTQLLPEQRKVLNRLLDGDTDERGGFEQGISASQYQKVAKVSKATATRHLADLLAKGCLYQLPGGGRSTRYQINLDGAPGVVSKEQA
ncbi:Fic family protein [Jeongeupia chitinilytica]|uniref:Fido domain-containing protein n=1 Tax=Jeongeupia chitinilytica TaxID=1041641 RepID=A0ABQ3GZ58_9NEIS|nr:Fic family protein [Jeongeupia chitinilytica]GHD56973.1 hypothetical protein GCM10007350_04960 [Jeongeupia chitinilytica]